MATDNHRSVCHTKDSRHRCIWGKKVAGCSSVLPVAPVLKSSRTADKPQPNYKEVCFDCLYETVLSVIVVSF